MPDHEFIRLGRYVFTNAADGMLHARPLTNVEMLAVHRYVNSDERRNEFIQRWANRRFPTLFSKGGI